MIHVKVVERVELDMATLKQNIFFATVLQIDHFFKCYYGVMFSSFLDHLPFFSYEVKGNTFTPIRILKLGK